MNTLTDLLEKKTFRIAIAGLGFGESVHIPAARFNKNIELIGLWHPREDKLQESCKRHGLIPYSSWEELINNPIIDGIIIATPPHPRFELSIQALEAGKHLLLEKPTCINADQVKDLQRKAIQRNLKVAVDYEYRAVPLFMQAKKIITQQNLGNPWFVKLDWLMSSRANTERPWNWYSSKNEGGGVIGAIGTHAIDILHWLIGPTQSVSALNSTAIKERICTISGTYKTVTSEDISISQLQLKTINNNLIPAQLSLSAVTKESRGFSLEIYGENGTLVLSSNNQKDYVHGFSLCFTKKGEKPKNIQPDQDFALSKTWTDGRIAPVARIHDWWYHSIKDETPIIPGLVEGLASQKVCDKIKESSSNGMKIQIS